MPNEALWNLEAEKAVLGGMLQDRKALVEAVLDPEDFYDSRNRAIYIAIRNVQNNLESNVEIQTVSDELKSMGEFERIGGLEYLVDVCDSHITFENFKIYVGIVQQRAILRSYIDTLNKVLKRFNDEGAPDINGFIGATSEMIRNCADRRKVGEFKHISEISQQVVQDIRTLKSPDDNGLTGVDTGFERLNQMTHGFQKKDMIILAARPSVGKTALGINIALNVAARSNVPVGIFSLEMPAEKIVSRMIGIKSIVELSKLATGHINSKETSAVEDAVREFKYYKIFIDDTANAKLDDILTKARKLKQEHPDLGMIMIDYIGLISAGSHKFESRQVQIQHYSIALKGLARELDCPVLVLCQLSRYDKKTGGVVSRTAKPSISDLRESGSIEQDADQVILLYKDDDANLSEQDMKKPMEPEDQPQVDSNGNISSILHVIVAKNRNGETGEFNLIFSKAYGEIKTPYEDK